MDWQEKKTIPAFPGWHYALGVMATFFLVAILGAFCLGAANTSGADASEPKIPLGQSPEKERVAEKERVSAAKRSEAVHSGETLKLNLPESFHAWGAFEPGAWSFSRTIVEGRRRSRISAKTLMETNVVLHEKQNGNFTTVTESYLLLAGKNIQKEPKTAQTDFFGLAPDEKREIEELPQEVLEIEGVPVRCRVLKITSKGRSVRREMRLWVNETTAPFLFRKERTCILPTGKCCENTVQKVTSMNLQLSVQGSVLSAYQYSQVSTFPTYIARSEVVASLSVPGRIVTQITHETDLRGWPLQDISTELLDYGTSSEKRQCGIYRSSVRAGRLIVTPPTSPNPATSSAPSATPAPVPSSSPASAGKTETVEVKAELSELAPESSPSPVPTESPVSSESPVSTEPAEDATVTTVWGQRAQITRSVSENRRFFSVEFSSQADTDLADTAVDGAVSTPSGSDWMVGVRPFSWPQGAGTVDFRLAQDPGFFNNFRSCWQLGRELQKPEPGFELELRFPHLNPSHWTEFVREHSVSSVLETSSQSRSPLYNRNLRSVRGEDSASFVPGRRFRVISTQSIREDSRFQNSEVPQTEETEAESGGALRRGIRSILFRGER